MAGKVTDGNALFRKLAPLFTADGLTTLPNEAPFSSLADREPVRVALDRWMSNCRRMFGDAFTVPAGPGNARAWQRERMEYTFSLGVELGGDTHELRAAEHFEGATDWATFDIYPGRKVGEPAPSSTTTLTFLPTSIHFRGMPHSRFWEIENSRVNLPKVSAARRPSPTEGLDAASQLFLDFALRYGNDWFSVPLPQRVGTASRIVSLVVSLTFGERFLVRHTNAIRPDANWQMFTLSTSADADTDADSIAQAREVFMLPATAGQILQSAPIEEVRLVRDEMANLAWAIESLVESPAGRRVDRAEQYARRRTAPAEPPSTGARPRYSLGSTVPDFWIPLLPRPQVPGEPPKLVRGAVPALENGEIVGGIGPEGRVLEPGTPLLIYDEEIPREGAVVKRRYRLARGADGSIALWEEPNRRHAAKRLQGCDSTCWIPSADPRLTTNDARQFVLRFRAAPRTAPPA